jgi:hypothetical protein
MEVGGETARVPSLPARALVITLHAAAHGERWERSVTDVQRALQRLPLEGWRAAAQLAERLDAAEAFGAGLRLTPEGTRMAEELGSPEPSSVEIRLRARSASWPALGVERFIRAPGLAAKVRYAFARVFPSRLFLEQWTGSELRTPSALIRAYRERLRYVVRSLPPAVRAWLGARRDAGPRPP